jgi:hypothetical protein
MDHVPNEATEQDRNHEPSGKDDKKFEHPALPPRKPFTKIRADAVQPQRGIDGLKETAKPSHRRER